MKTSHANSTRLGDIAKYIRGINFKPDDKVTPGTADSVVCMRTKNIQEDVDESDLIAVPKSFVKRKEQFLRPKDILVSSANSWNLVGKCVQVPLLNYIATAGGFISVVRSNPDRVNADYLFRWLAFEGTQHAVRKCARQTTNIANLDVNQFLDLEIPLPPLPEQQRIAGILGRADRLRRLRRYALELSEGYLQAVFLEMFGDQLRMEHSQTPMGMLVTITGGGTPSRDTPEYFQGNIPWLTSKDMRGDYIDDTQEHITEEAIRASATKLVPAGSILVVVKSKILMHRLPVAIVRVPLCHGQDIKSIQCSSGLDPLFAAQILRFNELRLLRQARGANTEGLTLPMLEEVPVPNVSIANQREFARTVERFDRLRAQQREALRQTEQLFQALLQRAFCAEV